MTRWTPMQRLKNDAIFVIAFVATRVVRPLPSSLLRAMGRGLGLLAWLFAGSARRIAVANVAHALPAVDAQRHVRRSFVELGGLLGDTIALLRRSHRADLPFSPGSREVLEAAQSEGRGVVLITAHLGPWERLAAALVEAGFALTTPVRVSYDPRLEAHVVAPLRKNRGVEAIDRDSKGASRALVRALRQGGIAGFLVDVDTRVASVRAPFFGRPARTPSGAARLAIGTGAPVVAAFATREGIAVELLRPASTRQQATEENVLELVVAMNAAIERAILQEPDRWIWMHDRFASHKKPTSPASAELVELSESE
ncbi:MAG: lysophospholipid acyltransferase family protein [Polyangiales bacterium]